jgi:RNA polymerase sigma factor (sigma-70 family)
MREHSQQLFAESVVRVDQHVEASAVHAPAGLARVPLGPPLLKLRSDEQLLDLFRSGSDEAFRAIYDRYRQRLFAYVRQMLGTGPRQDAEDVLQDVFVRAYGSLRGDSREVNVRAWLYRVAHNRCIDHLRRPTPPAADVFELSRKPLHDPMEEAQRREDLSRLVADIARLPEQQRSALLMREIDGLAYVDLAAALDVTVPAVKSLLVRARIGLVEAAEARDADCQEIRHDLLDAYDRGVKASSRARRHMRSCPHCAEYRTALRGMQRSFAALSPAGAGPLAMAAAKLLGLGGAGGGAAAGGSAAAGGGAAAVGGTVAACKVAAVVCTAALATGGAVEVTHLARAHRAPAPRPAPAAAIKAAPAPAPAPARTSTVAHTPRATYAPLTERPKHKKAKKPAKDADPKAITEAPATSAPTTPAPTTSGDPPAGPQTDGSGGAMAPADPPSTQPPPTTPPPATTGSGAGTTPPADSGTPPATGSDPGTPPPTEH